MWERAFVMRDFGGGEWFCGEWGFCGEGIYPRWAAKRPQHFKVKPYAMG
jgi:hypothetical protein